MQVFRAENDLGSEPVILLVQPRLFVVWKPPGWSVNVSNEEGGLQEEPLTAAASLGLQLHHWLQEKMNGTHPIVNDALVAHGILHRLDRETSGAILWAPCYSGFYAARLRMASRQVLKEYVCLCHDWVPQELTWLQAPILKVMPGENGKTLKSVVASHGKPARTEIRAVGHFKTPDGLPCSLVELRLHTGRLHQIRVHLSHHGHPLVGDKLYAGNSSAWSPRVFLHACRLSIDIGDGPMNIEIPLPKDLRDILVLQVPCDENSTLLKRRWMGND